MGTKLMRNYAEHSGLVIWLGQHWQLMIQGKCKRYSNRLIKLLRSSKLTFMRVPCKPLHLTLSLTKQSSGRSLSNVGNRIPILAQMISCTNWWKLIQCSKCGSRYFNYWTIMQKSKWSTKHQIKLMNILIGTLIVIIITEINLVTNSDSYNTYLLFILSNM